MERGGLRLDVFVIEQLCTLMQPFSVQMIRNCLVHNRCVQVNVSHKLLVHLREVHLDLLLDRLSKVSDVLEVLLVQLHRLLEHFFHFLGVAHQNLVSLLLHDFLLFLGVLPLQLKFL